MEGLLGALLLSLGVAVLEGRVLDKEIYKNYWDQPPSFFYDDLKVGYNMVCLVTSSHNKPKDVLIVKFYQV